MTAGADWLTEPLTYEFFVRGLAVSLLAGIVAGLLGCWLILIGWSLMGEAISHSVLPGVVLAYLVGAPFGLGALVFAAAAAVAIGLIHKTSRTKEDAAMGVVFTGLFSLGLVLVAVHPSQIDLPHILFGNVLGTSDDELLQLALLAGVSLLAALWKRRDLTVLSFDPAHAAASGLATRSLHVLLLGLLALNIVVGVQAVGVVLVVAMLITPAATANLLTQRFSTMLWLAPAFASAAALLGMFVSFHQDLPSGPTVVLCQAAGFAVAYLATLRVRSVRLSLGAS
jgi:manganese transport system permease protein